MLEMLVAYALIYWQPVCCYGRQRSRIYILGLVPPTRLCRSQGHVVWGDAEAVPAPGLVFDPEPSLGRRPSMEEEEISNKKNNI